MSKPTLTVTTDFTEQFNKIIKGFKLDKVLVGIPETTDKRKESKPINNAALLAINVFGSPLNNIPPRDVMTLGLKAAKDDIADQFKNAARSALSAGLSAIDTYYQRAGIIAANSIKKVINAQEGFEGPAESTLKARKSMGFSGTKSLIVTGQMRNAITYVVKKGL